MSLHNRIYAVWQLIEENDVYLSEMMYAVWQLIEENDVYLSEMMYAVWQLIEESNVYLSETMYAVWQLTEESTVYLSEMMYAAWHFAEASDVQIHKVLNCKSVCSSQDGPVQLMGHYNPVTNCTGHDCLLCDVYRLLLATLVHTQTDLRIARFLQKLVTLRKTRRSTMHINPLCVMCSDT